jgi:phosphomannomutase
MVHLETLFRCPGAAHLIGRAQHLGRLAAFDPSCRNCPHRDDASALTSETRNELRTAWQRGRAVGFLTDEGAGGTSLNDLSAGDVRLLVTAAAAHSREIAAGVASPLWLVGGDERSLTAELVAAAVDGLRFAGCDVVELGGVTAGSLVWAARHMRAQAALLVGNSAGVPHGASVQLFGGGGEPWSAGGDLDSVRAILEAGPLRGVRRSGSLRRWHAEPGYLDGCRERFHALRPLRLVLDTASQPLLRQLRAVLARTGVSVLSVQPPAIAPRTPTVSAPAENPYVARRLEWIAHTVRKEHADLGAWIDGDGQRSIVFDERGQILDVDQLVTALAARPLSGSLSLAESPPSPLSCSPPAESPLSSLTCSLPPAGRAREGGCPARVEATRQAMYQTMLHSGATLGRDQAGRIWLAEPEPTVDALLMLATLLGLLSETDRPLSQVLDAVDVGK